MSFVDASVGTDKMFRERFSVLPEMKSKFVQTDASWLRSRSIAVNTDVDPFFGVWRRRRMRGTHPVPHQVASAAASSRETQTDFHMTPVKDASAQVNICCKIDLRSATREQPHEPEPITAHEEEMLVQQTDQLPQQLRGSLTSISSMDMEPSPEPVSPEPLKLTVDQAISPISITSPSPPPPPPPPLLPASPAFTPPVAAVEVIITPPPPIALPIPDSIPVTSASAALPPAPKARSAVTSGTNSQNISSDEDADDMENKRFKALKDDHEKEFFMKYAMKPRRGTTTLRSIKARSESRRPSIRSQSEAGDETRSTQPAALSALPAEAENTSEEMQTAEAVARPLPPVATTPVLPEKTQSKISNVDMTDSVVPSNAAPTAEPGPESRMTTEPASLPIPQKDVADAQTSIPVSNGKSKEYIERLKDPEFDEKEPVKKKRKEVLSASSPNLVSDDSSTTSIIEAVNMNDAELQSQGNEAQNKMLIKVTPREMRTESKIIIEVINSRRREVSEVTSYSEVQADGKITRKTTVTTSKKVPVLALGHAKETVPEQSILSGQSTFPQRRHPGKTPEPIVTSPPSTKATSSPVPNHAKSTTTMQSVAPSECSSRPTSAADDIAIGTGITPASSHPESFASSATSPDARSRSMGSSLLQPRDTSHFLSPAYSDPEVEKVAKIVQQVFDPYHLVLNKRDSPKHEATQSVPATLDRKSKQAKTMRQERATPTQTVTDRQNSGAKSPPPSQLVPETAAVQTVRSRPRVYWHETSHSMVTNEMVTDAYKDDSGTILKPKAVTMQSETLIDNTGKDSKITTRSKASRQFNGHIQEPEITSETTVNDTPPILQIEPRRLGYQRPDAESLPMPQHAMSSAAGTPVCQQGTEAARESVPEKEIQKGSSRIPLATPAALRMDRKKRMKSDPGKVSVKSSGISSAGSTTAMSTPPKSTSRTSIKSPAFIESSLDDLDIPIPDVLSPNILSTDISSRDPESRADSGLLSSPLSPAEKKSRGEQIRDSARKGQLFSEVNKAFYGKSLSFADLNGDSPGAKLRKQPVEQENAGVTPKRTMGPQKLNPKLKSSNDLDKVMPILPGLPSSKSGTELVTRITRRSHPAEIVEIAGRKELKPKRSKMVLEQDIKTGDGMYDVSGCQMVNRITVDNPCVKKKSRHPFFSFGKLKRKIASHQQLAIESDEQEKEDETKEGKKKSKKVPGRKSSKEFSKSLGDLRAPEDEEADERENQGVMLTETKFERLKPNPATGRSNHQTSWEYSLECNCINGLNTSVKTNVKHRRSYVPSGLTLYESSV